MAAARTMYAGLRLLDRQLVDRAGRLCGKVDDLELEASEDGTLHVTALLTGPGALLLRTGRTRLGGWLRDAFERRPDEPASYGRIPLRHVALVGSHIRLDLDSEDVSTFAVERWVRDHLIDHVPGSRHEEPS